MMHYLSRDEDPQKPVKSEYHCATLIGNWEEERRAFGQEPLQVQSSTPLETETTCNTTYKQYSPEAIADAKPTGCFCEEAPRALLFFHGDLANPVKNQLTVNELSYVAQGREPAHTNDEVLDMTGVSRRRDRTNALRRSAGLPTTDEMGTGTRTASANRSAALMKESTLLRSMTQSVRSQSTNTDMSSGGATDTSKSAEGTTGEATTTTTVSQEGTYTPPQLAPLGRVAERDRFLSTKQVTIDATGVYLHEHPLAYPLTSSVCVGKFMASMNNPMHKTKLRYECE